jgi:short-subunit dehydrogenase
MLINNAGYGFTGAIEETSESEIAKVLAINVEATLRMTRYVLPVMRKAGNGHIINLSSASGLVSAAGFGIYNATAGNFKNKLRENNGSHKQSGQTFQVI